MDALDHACISKEEEHHKRLLEIGNEMLHQPPSSKEELLEKLDDFFELAVLAFENLSCLDGRCYSKAVSIIEVLAKYRTCVLMLDLELDPLIVQMFQHFLNRIRPDHPDQVFMNIEEIMTMIIKESEEIPMQLLNILVNILIRSVKKENQNVSPRSYVLGEKVLKESAVKLHPYLPNAVTALGISFNNYSEVVELIWRGATKSKTTVENAPEELAPHAARERVAPFLVQHPNLLGKEDPKHKDDDVVLETDTTLKESERGDAMKQQKNTDSRTTSRPENLDFINAAKKALDPEATQTSNKRGWKPSFLIRPEEGYDDAWISGERRSKAHILLKGHGKDTKKRRSSSSKCAISDGLSFSSGEDKSPIMTSTKRRQKEKSDKIGQNDGAQFSSISARDSAEAITKKKVSQPTSFASEEFTGVEALEEKHEKDDKKTVPCSYRDKRRRSSVGKSGAEALVSVSNTKESNFPTACLEQRKRKNSPSQEEGKATDDPTPPTMTMQHNLTPKGVHQNKGIKVDVHGYEVKVSNAPILAAIFAKYGDIAINCHYKSSASRASLLDLVCDVVMRLKNGDVGSSSIKFMKSFVSAAADVKLDVTWLQQYLDEISAAEDMEKKSSDLMDELL